METVVVLLSTYNGEKYLKEQIESIISQRNVNIKLIVRDDGSKDSTIDILDDYKNRGLLTYYKGKNLGPIWSFMDLMYNAPSCKYYALSDQDDVWDLNKLYKGICALDNDRPSLYYHGMDVVDENLESYDFYFREEVFSKSLEYSCLYGDEIAGCTMIFNEKLLDKIKEYKPAFLTMHDGWIHRVCLCVHGSIYADKSPLIHYRQHSSNTVGMKKRHIRDKVALFIHKDPKFSKLAGEMFKGYQKYLTSEERGFLESAANYHSITNKIVMIKRTLRSKVPQKIKRDLLFKLMANMY